MELAIVTALSLPGPLFFFLNQVRRDLVDAVSVLSTAVVVDDGNSDIDDEVLSVALDAEVALDADLDLDWGPVGVERSAVDVSVSVPGSDRGASFGVAMGVTSVEGVTSTSSASRYHFRRRV